jgi:hypothetical protein
VTTPAVASRQRLGIVPAELRDYVANLAAFLRRTYVVNIREADIGQRRLLLIQAKPSDASFTADYVCGQIVQFFNKLPIGSEN